MTPIVNIVGEKIALGPMEREAARRLAMWGANDFATQRTARKGPPDPATWEMIDASYDRHAANDTNVAFLIYERATETAIGTTSLNRVDYWNGTAMFGITIGDPATRGKGYGTEATLLTLDYVFTALGLHSVHLGVIAFNHAGIRAYERAGFREYGRRHECWRMGNTRYDEVLMEALATDFVSPVLARLLTPEG